MMKQIHKTLVLAGSFAALLSLGGCATTALVDGGRGAVLPDKATVQNELQGRAFTLGRVYLDITKPTDKSSHVLPDDAYVKLLRSQLETAFRNAGLSQGKQPAYTVDVAINEFRFIEGYSAFLSSAGTLKTLVTVTNPQAAVVASQGLYVGDAFGPGTGTTSERNMAHRFNIPAMAEAVTKLVTAYKQASKPSIRPASIYLLKHSSYGMTVLTKEQTKRITGINLDDYR
ncbi:hypothetical protein RG903_05010 [Thermithiobacillus tepidarius DSM 3134]|uniref:hypothetical protein n=2 Tax=Thermithiobacillus tepidarius TaxID=929 RepID=UPI003AAADE02